MCVYIQEHTMGETALGRSTLAMLKEGQNDCSPVSKGEYGNQIKLEKLADAKP